MEPCWKKYGAGLYGLYVTPLPILSASNVCMKRDQPASYSCHLPITTPSPPLWTLSLWNCKLIYNKDLLGEYELRSFCLELRPTVSLNIYFLLAMSREFIVFKEEEYKDIKTKGFPFEVLSSPHIFLQIKIMCDSFLTYILSHKCHNPEEYSFI